MKASDLPLQYNAVDILERNLAQRADKTALLSAEREITFAALSEETNRTGNALRSLGVNFGDVVALLALDSVEWVSGFFGTIKIGAVALSLNTLLKPHDYRLMLDDCRARVVMCHPMFAGAVQQIRDQLPHLEHVLVLGSDEHRAWLAASSPELTACDTHREDICSLNYSSGTTGEPKGIPHAHKDLPLCAELWGKGVLGLTEDDRTFAAAKLFFTFGTGGNLIFPFYVGASAVLLAGSPRDVDNVSGTVARFRPTILYNAPTGYAMALAQDDFADRYDLSSLRLCVSAGEALPAHIGEQWQARTGRPIVDGIGSTENYHIFLSNRPDDIRYGSSGKPFAGYDLKLVDDDGVEVPRGEVGNLWVRGETAALGYLHQYDKSRQTFRGAWLVTGDKYQVDEDGYYWHRGRSDDMLKVGGIWVSPVEVEGALIGHDAVVECAVVGITDQDELVKPLAYVVLKAGHQPTLETAQALVAHCRDALAQYKRPRWVEFVEELPKTATGKIQRFQLRGGERGQYGAVLPLSATLEPLQLELDEQPLPPPIAAFLADADARIAAWYAEYGDDARTGFYPSNYPRVYHALRAARRQVAEAERFCEWGCGVGAVVGLAVSLGYEAYGIEIHPGLLDHARSLLADHGLEAELLEGSFIPASYAEHETVTDLDTRTLVTDHGAPEADLEIADCDLIFAFPWPTEEELFCDLFQKHAADGAVLITHHDIEGIRAYRKWVRS